eukprot:TRINITY_DN22891_c0_g1_i1.p1 TRINITY_DN22891_c0_g1~~TRINITY_DN22891_c0_g1_i1.p1  ORF type:complete len:692 (+),score=101.86 TRINITY_DN22891_c0_g1_i1:941-3016(+)
MATTRTDSNNDEERAPGALSAEKKTPLPFGPFAALSVMYFTNSLSQTILFPFAAVMVREFHVTSDPANLGYYAGFLASSAFTGALLTSSLWGSISDRFGRKSVLLIGLFANAVCALWFGSSQTFANAMAARFVNGLFSTVVATGRSAVAELCDESNQAQGFALIGTNFGVGLLFGPSLGGFLSQPAEKYPSLFPKGSFFDHYPFLLPCIVLSLLSFTGAIITLFLLPETLGRARKKGSSAPSSRASTNSFADGSNHPSGSDLQRQRGHSRSASRMNGQSMDGDLRRLVSEDDGPMPMCCIPCLPAPIEIKRCVKKVVGKGDDSMTDPLLPSASQPAVAESKRAAGHSWRTGHRPLQYAIGQLKKDPTEEQEKEQYVVLHRADTSGWWNRACADREEEVRRLAHEDLAWWKREESGRFEPNVDEEAGDDGEDPRSWAGFFSVLLARDTVVTTCMFCVLSFANTGFNEVFPLWAITPWSMGGLSFGTNEIAIAQTFAGAISIPMQLWVYAPLVERIGAVNALRLVGGSGILLSLFPQARMFGEGTFAFYVAILFFMALRTFPGCIFTSIFVLISNSVEDPQYLGAVNGFVQSLNMVFRALSPTVSASIYAWSTSQRGAFINTTLFFYFGALLYGIMILIAGCLSSRAEERKFVTLDAEEIEAEEAIVQDNVTLAQVDEEVRKSKREAEENGKS